MKRPTSHMITSADFLYTSLTTGASHRVLLHQCLAFFLLAQSLCFLDIIFAASETTVPRPFVSKASFETTTSTSHDRLVVTIFMDLAIITIRSKAVVEVRIIADEGQK